MTRLEFPDDGLVGESLQEALDVLKLVEWDDDMRCPVCGGREARMHPDDLVGHRDDCKLGKILGRV